MQRSIIFSLPGNALLTARLAEQLSVEIGSLTLHEFPDGESYICIHSNVEDKTVILVCGLDHPNNKVLNLMFTAQTLKELGANKICLISPYLSYLRQDKRFKSGEAVTSTLFARYLSGWIDSLMTIDPHLHRIQNLSEIYTLPSISVLHANAKIAKWIQDNVDSPLIIGPDEESRQWVADIAESLSAPYVIIKKVRFGDQLVSVTIPDIDYIDKTPVLVDDIISSGSSMLAVIQQIMTKGYKKPICIGVHALFNTNVYENLLAAGASKLITCNTILNASNTIDVTDLFVEEIKRLQLC